MSTDTKKIVVSIANTVLTNATALFAAPEGSRQKQDLIRMWSVDTSPQGKFTLHTMAQRALFDFEDNELTVQWQPPESVLTATFGNEAVAATNGVVLTLDKENRLSLYAQEGVDVIGFLRAIHRYATRMIRLDVR